LLRPRSLDEIVGQDHLVGPDGPLRRLVETRQLTSMILWGPAGTGKTTLARIVTAATGYEMESLSAVSSGVKDVREAITRARERLGERGIRTVLFIDEVHRFNKAQQDLLLPATETGEVVLIGATTENPYFEVNAALMSRSTLWRLRPLGEQDLEVLVGRGLELRDATISDEAREAITSSADGDARSALTTLDTAIVLARVEGERTNVELDDVARARDGRLYHQSADTHYDQISAFIKSVRGSDPDAAMYWLVTLLESGESARFIARRLVILASEDVGLADPLGLLVAESAARANRRVRGTSRSAVDLGSCDDHARLDAQEQFGDACPRRGECRGPSRRTRGSARAPSRRLLRKCEEARTRKRLSLRARLPRGLGRSAVLARPVEGRDFFRPERLRTRSIAGRAVARANEPLPPG
jgi:putative ATPase